MTAPSSSGLGRKVLILVTPVRIRVGSPESATERWFFVEVFSIALREVTHVYYF